MKHIVIEANCFYEEGKEIPKCCKLGVENVSINCLKYDSENRQYCPYLVFGTTKATLVLTDEEGHAINADGYWGDINMSDEEWIKEEGEWIDKQNRYISNN